MKAAPERQPKEYHSEYWFTQNFQMLYRIYIDQKVWKERHKIK